MMQLTCEMCGGTDLLKQDGVFVCQKCGCKYSVEEAKKLLNEGAVRGAGTVKSANFGLVDSYLTMAQSALDAGNNAEAENYANKIIEINPLHYLAWFIKGKAAGWQTTGGNNRYPESIVAWIKSYQSASEEERESLRTDIQNEAANISFAILQMKGQNFSSLRSDKNKDEVVNTLSMIERQLKELKDCTEIDIYTEGFQTALARSVNACVVNASNECDMEFATNGSGRFAWDRYTQSKDRCLELLDQIYDLSADDDLSLSICKNYIRIAETTRDSCSYTYDYREEYSFTSGARKVRTEAIEKWINKRDYHEPTKRHQECEITLIECGRKLVFLEESLAFSKYWKEYEKERMTLIEEKRKREEKVAEIQNHKVNNPLLYTRSTIASEIADLQSQINEMGVFQGKEKKELQEQLSMKEMDLKSTNDRLWNDGIYCDSLIQQLNAQIWEIDNELNQSRGRIPLVHSDTWKIFESEKKELSLSPVELLHSLSKKTPYPFGMKTGKESDIINRSELEQLLTNIASSIEGQLLHTSNIKSKKWVDDPNKCKTYRISFYMGQTETKTSILCDAKSMKKPIEKNLRFHLETGFTVRDASDFTIILSVLLFEMMPSAKIEELQKVIAAGLYGITDSKGFVSDGIKVGFTRQARAVTVTVSQ